MNNIASYLVADVYQGSNPMMNTLSSGCYVNGQSVPCGPFEGMFAGFSIIWLVLIVISIVSLWKIFTKAGQPGWAAIIPIYNVIVMLQIVRKPIWWIIMFFIPFVNIFFAIALVYNLAKAFNKGVGFMLGMIFLTPIFYPILAFGSSRYVYGQESQPGQPIPPAQPGQSFSLTPPASPVPPAQPSQPTQFVR